VKPDRDSSGISARLSPIALKRSFARTLNGFYLRQCAVQK
jgi:hypothetical protein